MEEIQKYLKQLEIALNRHPEYKPEAYNFVMSGLHYTTGKLKEHRHITGQELSVGIKEYALEQYGVLAKTVLNYWGITETYDFGKIVYNLIEVGLMTKTEEDSLEDFKNVYNFDDAFLVKIDFDIE
jgi:uncharacterized repeat protein (TIGR04138 family)